MRRNSTSLHLILCPFCLTFTHEKNHPEAIFDQAEDIRERKWASQARYGLKFNLSLEVLLS
jgi:hypothetical protein